jgi:cytoskeletal protein RodZ
MLRDDQADFSWNGRRKFRLPGKSLILPFLLVGLGIWLGRAYFSNIPVEELVSIQSESKREASPKHVEPLTTPASPNSAEPRPALPLSKPPLPTEVLNLARPKSAQVQNAQVHAPNVSVKKSAPPDTKGTERFPDYRALREELLSQSD